VPVYVISGLELALLAAFPIMISAHDSSTALPSLKYPAATLGAVVEEHHGTKVADPYHWMEIPGEAVSNWVAAQNELSQPYLDAIPARETIRARLNLVLRHVRIRVGNLRRLARNGMAFLEPGAEIDQLAALAAERAPGIIAPFPLAPAMRTVDQRRHRDQ